MGEKKKTPEPHDFTKIPEFDETMQKLVEVPKENVVSQVYYCPGFAVAAGDAFGA